MITRDPSWPFVTVSELHDDLAGRFSRSALYTAVKVGDIPSERWLGRVYIRKAWVNKFFGCQYYALADGAEQGAKPVSSAPDTAMAASGAQQ